MNNSLHKWAVTMIHSLASRKKCLNVAIIVLLLVAAVLLNVLYSLTKNLIRLHKEELNKTHRSAAVWPSGFYPHNTFGFHPVNEKGVYSFWNVCIEPIKRPVTQEIDFMGRKILFNETAKIIVYNSFYRDGLQRLHVSGSHNSPWNHWDVHFRRGRIPVTHRFHNTTAYFVVQTCPANLHHFWIDEFVPLYGIVNRANKLHPEEQNQIFYRRPTDQAGSDISGCYNKTVFEDILKTLFISPFHDVFYRAPVNECYSSAVFGVHPFVTDPRHVVDHVLRNVLNPSAYRVNPDQSYFVTFIQRKYRRILNVRELLKAVLWAGFRRVRIIDFERHSVAEQMSLAATSCLMVGIQGAGLQWSVFMPRGCTLIEIAWPSQHWGFHFRSYVEPYGITYHNLRATAHPNWAAYERNVRNGSQVPLEERIAMLQKPPRSPSLDNVWKWADGFVNKEHFIEILSSIDLKPHDQIPSTPDPLFDARA